MYVFPSKSMEKKTTLTNFTQLQSTHFYVKTPDDSVIGNNMTYSQKFHRNAFGYIASPEGHYRIHFQALGLT
jgi:hypothetical protein